MRLLHFSDKPVTSVTGRKQYDPGDKNPLHRTAPGKPRGFWVSVEGAWHDWCINEGFRMDDLKHVHEVTLDEDKAKILRISTEEQLRVFAKRYRHPYNDELFGGIVFSDGSVETMFIDWRKVAKKYHGIIIAPYIGTMRLATGQTWYYGWDVASGCIWNKRAIKSIKELPSWR